MDIAAPTTSSRGDGTADVEAARTDRLGDRVTVICELGVLVEVVRSQSEAVGYELATVAWLHRRILESVPIGELGIFRIDLEPPTARPI